MGRRVRAASGGQRVDQGAALVEIELARQRQSRHVAPPERADEGLEVEGAAPERPAVHDDLVVEPDEGEGVLAPLVADGHHTVPKLREGGGDRGVRERVEGVGGERARDLGDQPLDRRLGGREPRVRRAAAPAAGVRPAHPAPRRRSQRARISGSRERRPRSTSQARASGG